MNTHIDLWSIESHLYALIDANGMRGNYTYNKTFDLGNNHFVDVKITNFSRIPLSNHSVVNVNEFVIGLNFRKAYHKQPWFRIDNESKDKEKTENYLHFHCDLNGKVFAEHQKIIGSHTVAEIISMTFDRTRAIIKEKFPDEEIIDGSGFVGWA